MEEFRHPGESGKTETWLRWAFTVVITLGAFVSVHAPGLVFFVRLRVLRVFVGPVARERAVYGRRLGAVDRDCRSDATDR